MTGIRQRFRFTKCLGKGGFGEVWEVFDTVRQTSVALKILQNRELGSIRRFKNEFRRLSHVSHPNLVSLYELISDGESWTFTMELCPGPDFVTYIRRVEELAPSEVWDQTTLRRTAVLPAAPPGAQASLPKYRVALEPEARQRLRLALPQLLEGLDALHRRGLLHRDLKPSNVLVSEDRVVLVDFGLAKSVSADRSTQPGFLVGTPRFMAPEQLFGGPASRATDLYSVGIILFEALSGTTPHGGEVSKRLAGGVPELRVEEEDAEGRRWAQLCHELTRSEPGERPSASEALDLLGVARRSVFSARMDEDLPLVGREQELRILESMAENAREGPEVAVLVGPSGIGKSALLRSLAAGLRDDHGYVVAEGRCYERETMPLEALDVLVDSLVVELLARPGQPELLPDPEDAAALVEAFPAFRELPEFGFPAPLGPSGVNSRAARRAMESIVQLFRALSGDVPLAILIDDVQWGDSDSAAILGELAQASLPVLLVLASRGKSTAPSAFLDTFMSVIGPRSEPRMIELGPLDARSSVELLTRVERERSSWTLEEATRLSEESGGHPLLLTELALHARERTEAAPLRGVLEELFDRRIEALDPSAQEILSVLAVAARPLAEPVAVTAAGLGSTNLASSLDLRNEGLATATRQGKMTFLEVTHDRYRELLTDRMEPTTLARWHDRIARTLQAQTPEAVDALALHTRAAGDEESAARYGLLAARRAADRHALRDAAGHYANAFALIEKRPRPIEGFEDGTETLETEYAQVLRQIGDYDQAVQVLEASRERAPRDRLESLRIQLGGILHESGDIAAATRELERALADRGVHAPSSRLAAARKIAFAAACRVAPVLVPLRYRWGRSPEHVEDVAHVLNVLMRIYYFEDVEKLVWAGLTIRNLTRYMSRRERLAEASFNYGALLFGMGFLRGARRWCRRAVELAREHGTPSLLAVSLSRLGTCEVFADDIPAAQLALFEAVDTFEDAGAEMWEHQTGLMLTATSHFMASNFQEALKIYERMGALARRLGASRHRAWSLSWAPFCRYLMGTEDAASVRAQLHEALELSDSIGDIANQCAAAKHLSLLAARERDLVEAEASARRAIDLIVRYLVPVPFLQMALVSAAEAAMVVLETAGPEHPRRAELERLVRRALRRSGLLGHFFPYLAGPTHRMWGRYWAWRGQPTRALRSYSRAMAVLEGTPHKWELALTMIDRSAVESDRQAWSLEESRVLLTEIGAHGELARYAVP